MRKAAVLLLACLMLVPAAFGASSIEAKASVDRKAVKLGDVISYTISVKREGSGGNSPEVAPPSFEGFRVTGSYSQNSVNIVNGAATIVTNLQYDLIAVKSGEITIPPAKIAVINPATGQREEIETKPVIVTVTGGKKSAATAVAAATATPVEDIKEIKMSMAFRFSDLIPYIILALLFIIAVAVAWKMIFAKKPLAPVTKDETDYKEDALKMLAKAAEKLKSGDIKGYYYDIYEAVRFFLAKHLGESFAELTTQEIIRKLKGKLSDGKVSRISQFMSDCDMVKFADFRPEGEEARQASMKAEEIILKT
jgi:HEPN domain-containing protein